MRSSGKKRFIRMIAGLLMACILLPMLPAAAVEETIPETTEPAVTEPVVTEPEVTEPETTEPAVTEPEETEPEVTEPAVTEPAVTEPAVTDPEVIEPEVTEPEVTEPAVTEPKVTEPEVTEPEEIKPEVTEPETTEPETTEPVLVVEDGDVAKALNAVPAMTVTFDGAAFPEDGIYENWHYNDKKVLNVALSGLNPGQTYTVTIQLDEVVYFDPKPMEPADGAYKVTFKENTPLPVGKAGDKSYIKEESGTAVFTFTPAKDSLSFSVDLRYDITLWNRLEGSELRWNNAEDASLIKVTLQSNENTLDRVELQNATAAVRHHANLPDESTGEYKDGTNGVRPVLDGTTDLRLGVYNKNDTIRMRIQGFANNFYFGDMGLKITMPHCEIDGTSYYMELVGIENTGENHYVDSADVQDLLNKQQSTISLTIPNVYEKSDLKIIDLLFKFPEAIWEKMEAGATYDFPYEIEYAVNGDTYIPSHYGAGVLQVRGGDGAYLEFFQAMSGAASTTTPEGVVDSLGGMGLINSGNQDCENVQFGLLFDKNNTNAIGVTTVNLMTDVVSEKITGKYRMVDENGNQYPADGSFEKFEIDNPNYGKEKPGTDRYATFHRGMLEGEYKELYFKEIVYTVGTIEAGVSVGAQNNPRSPHTPGSYWGRALKAGTDTPMNEGYIVSADGKDGCDVTWKDSKMNLATKIDQEKDARMQLILNSTGFLNTKEIYAGDTAELSIRGIADNYIGGQSYGYVDNLRIGLLLPVGIKINESSITAKLYRTVEGKLIETKEINNSEINVTYKAADAENTNNFWILEFPDNNPQGVAMEDLKELPLGRTFIVTLQISTPKTLSETTLVPSDILYLSGEDYVTTRSVITKRDLYDVNQNGRTNDLVTGLSIKNDKNLVIRGNSVSLNITDQVLLNNEVQTTSDIAINSAEDTIEYRMNIVNPNGGTAKNFESYFKVPQTLNNGTGAKIIMSGAGTASSTVKNTVPKWVYTTQTVENLVAAQALPDGAWTETVDSWENVTWAKLIFDEKGVENGAEVNVSIPLKYSGADYSYYAGASATLKSEGNYDYVRGNFSLPIGIDTIQRTLFIHYKESSAKGETTLTAALDRKPTDLNVNTWTFDSDDGLNLKFYNDQRFRVKNLNGYNVELVNVDYENEMKSMSGEESNEKYMIKAGLTSADTAILEDAEVGTLEKDAKASFIFELYNGNVLTEPATQRYVTFDLVSDYVTIPVKINIQQEATLAEAEAPAIVAGKRYAPITDSAATSVSISKDSAFTAQFVVDNMNANYGTRTLVFDKTLPVGTTIVLIDYAKLEAPRYARYAASGSETQIALTSFKMMGGSTAYSSYTIPAGSTETSFKEQLLFVVDYPGGNGVGNTVKLKIDDTTTENKDIETSTLTVNVAAQRQFSAAISDDTTVGSEFTLTATVKAAGAADSRYNGRQMAFVVDGSNVPADGKLTADGVEYTRNSENQYIIPLGVAQTNGNYSKKLVLEADSLKNGENCELTAELWVSATAAAEKPMMGDRVVSGLSITLTTEKEPSLKVNSMSQRVLDREELKENVSLSYSTKDIPAGAVVTLEIQKATGSTYITESVYAEQVTGSTDLSSGVYTVPSEGGNLTLRFSSSLEAGNYRILFKVTDSGGKELLEVPCRFIVVD